MCFRFPRIITLSVCLAAFLACRPSPPKASSAIRVLKVCADPNNLPFSNDKGEGFENRLAELIARELNARVEYTWFAQRRGFIRHTLGAGLCDVVMGVPANFELVETTRPYYRSTYVFLTREDRNLHIASLDDPSLRSLNIGVHLVGDDYSNPPPAHALSQRGLSRNIRGFSIYGNYSVPNPPSRLVEAVANKEIDVAIIWGPFAGYFGRRQPVRLRITPVASVFDQAHLPFAFQIAMGVRKGERDLGLELDRVAERREREISLILAEYGVPAPAEIQHATSRAVR